MPKALLHIHILCLEQDLFIYTCFVWYSRRVILYQYLFNYKLTLAITCEDKHWYDYYVYNYPSVGWFTLVPVYVVVGGFQHIHNVEVG